MNQTSDKQNGTPSLIYKNAIKEGLKRAQNFGLLHKGSGLRHFCTTVDIADGDFNCILHIMEGVNKDKKASEWAKILLSSDDDKIVGIAHVPAELSKQTDLVFFHYTHNFSIGSMLSKERGHKNIRFLFLTIPFHSILR